MLDHLDCGARSRGECPHPPDTTTPRAVKRAYVAGMAIAVLWSPLLDAAAPVLAFAGSWVGTAVGRKSARELDRWRRREETMRLLRWAAEMGTSGEEPKTKLGVATLRALAESELLQEQDYNLLDAVNRSLLQSPAGAYGNDEPAR